MAQKTTCAEDGHNGDDETETGDLLEYGIVDPTLRRGLRRAVLAEVVLPSARQLLSRSRVSSETLVATLPSERLPSHVLQSADKLTMDRISLAS